MRQWPIPDECFNTDNGRLLHWTAERAAEVLAEWHTSPDPPVIGFCFSFPVEQTALDNGRIVGCAALASGCQRAEPPTL